MDLNFKYFIDSVVLQFLESFVKKMLIKDIDSSNLLEAAVNTKFAIKTPVTDTRTIPNKTD